MMSLVMVLFWISRTCISPDVASLTNIPLTLLTHSSILLTEIRTRTCFPWGGWIVLCDFFPCPESSVSCLLRTYRALSKVPIFAPVWQLIIHRLSARLHRALAAFINTFYLHCPRSWLKFGLHLFRTISWGVLTALFIGRVSSEVLWFPGGEM